MPRPLRIEAEDAWYHIMNRGANYQAIFLNDKNRQIFLNLLAELNDWFGVQIHSYCLMDNHYHLLIRTQYPNLSKAMKHLNGIYTQKFNRDQKKDGALFRGRYKAIMIDADDYLLQVSRYIHLNPVVAGICSNAHGYSWSSYRIYSGDIPKPTWMEKEFILNMISKCNQNEAYVQFVNSGIDALTEKFYSKKYHSPIFGGKDFIKLQLKRVNDELQQASSSDIKRAPLLPNLELISDITLKYFKLNSNDLINSVRGKKNYARMVSMYLSKKLGQRSYRELASYFTGISIAGVTAAVRRCEKLMTKDQKLKEDLEKLGALLRR